MLKEVLDLNAKFIVLDFKEEELVLKYEKKHGIFTKSYRIGSFSIEKIALRVHFMDLVEK